MPGDDRGQAVPTNRAAARPVCETADVPACGPINRNRVLFTLVSASDSLEPSALASNSARRMRNRAATS